MSLKFKEELRVMSMKKAVESLKNFHFTGLLLTKVNNV